MAQRIEHCKKNVARDKLYLPCLPFVLRPLPCDPACPPDGRVSDFPRRPLPSAATRFDAERLAMSVDAAPGGGGSVAAGNGRSTGLPGGVGGSGLEAAIGDSDESAESRPEAVLVLATARRSRSADIRLGDMAAPVLPVKARSISEAEPDVSIRRRRCYMTVHTHVPLREAFDRTPENRSAI
jgi:hypothetical protein